MSTASSPPVQHPYPVDSWVRIERLEHGYARANIRAREEVRPGRYVYTIHIPGSGGMTAFHDELLPYAGEPCSNDSFLQPSEAPMDLVKELSRYLAYDAISCRNRTWVNRVRTHADGVTVLEDLSGWAD